jgi:PAS domain S-box-containing protein
MSAVSERRSAAAFPAGEEYVAQIAGHASDAIALLEATGQYTYGNPACEKLFGCVGADFFERIHADDRNGFRQLFQDTLKDGAGTAGQFRVQTDGDVRHVESRLDFMPGKDAQPAHVIVVSRDVSGRCLADTRLQARLASLLEIQDIAKLGGFDWDMRDDFIDWSPELKRIFGVGDAFQPTLSSFGDLVHPEDREWVVQMAHNTFNSGTLYKTPYRILRPDGEIRVVEAHSRVSRDETGKPVRLTGALQDVTDRKWAEDQVRTTEEQFSKMVENVRDYAICQLDKKGHVTHWNLGAQRMTGYRNNEILGKHYACFFTQDQIAAGEPQTQLDVAVIDGKYKGGGWRVRKGGARFWTQVIVTPLYDELGGVRGYSMIIHDITRRLRVQEDLRSYAARLRAVSMRLVEIQEAERRDLATVLHDRVGQNLTAIGINLSLVAGGLAPDANPDLAVRIRESADLVQDTADAMRNVTEELRPQTLDDYGLAAALRALAADFSRRTRIKTSVTGGGEAGFAPKSVDLAMFRIAQEALNNIAKHASATRVEIMLEVENMHATLAITDDGIGFDANQNGNAGHRPRWGLLIMRERAEAAGARFTLHANPGAGVQIFVRYQL